MSIYSERTRNIEGNTELRTPQREGYRQLAIYYQSNPVADDREVSIILPVGCGKSGLISIAPFAFSSHRTLIVAPGLNIASQLYADVDPTNPSCFYITRRVLTEAPYPEPVEIRGRTSNIGDLQDADVVVTNIQQLQGQSNRWLEDLPNDFFDLIQFDEGHHNVAESWETLRRKFPSAKIVNYSATPRRADGQLMSGRVIYSYPVFDAIREGFVKRLKAIVLNPRTLRYIRREDSQEVEVGLDEVRRLGEEDSSFRRSIVTSQETLLTIVDASINELNRLRTSTNESRLKIIATALNQEHCIQVTEAYRARGMRADYVHSNIDGAVNQRILNRLNNHELDVIIQVRKLGEGFNHPYLSVAAIFNVFSSLSPFVQFVGRIMRVIDSRNPLNPVNRGTVIYHAGSNIARLWTDFQDFSQADQQYFDELLPEEALDFDDAAELEIEPRERNVIEPNEFDIRGQVDVTLQEQHLLDDDEEARRAFELLVSRGFTAEQYQAALQHRPVPTTRIRERQAMRFSLDDTIRNRVGRILAERGLNPGHRNLDVNHLGRTNYLIVKAAIDNAVNEHIGRASGERSEFSRIQLEQIQTNFETIIAAVIARLFNA